MQVLAGDQRKDVVLTAGIHVETKQCKTLFINTAPLLPAACFPVAGCEKYRRGKYLGRNSGNTRSLLREKFGGAIFGRGEGGVEGSDCLLSGENSRLIVAVAPKLILGSPNFPILCAVGLTKILTPVL